MSYVDMWRKASEIQACAWYVQRATRKPVLLNKKWLVVVVVQMRKERCIYGADHTGSGRFLKGILLWLLSKREAIWEFWWKDWHNLAFKRTTLMTERKTGGRLRWKHFRRVRSGKGWECEKWWESGSMWRQRQLDELMGWMSSVRERKEARRTIRFGTAHYWDREWSVEGFGNIVWHDYYIRK